LGGLANALANVAPVNLNALSNALGKVNLSAISNFTNAAAVVSVVSANPATGIANGQQIFNTTDNKLYVWRSDTATWSNVAATYTPSASDMAKVEIWSTTPKPTTGLFDGRTILYTADSNLYINVSGVWNSYNSYIQGSGTPTISAGSINSAALQSGIVTADKIATGAITAGKIAAAVITSAEIGAGNITASLLAADSVIAGKIAAGVITATQIAANTIIAENIAANAITAAELAANAVYAGSIMANAITVGTIAANAITAVAIAANAVYAGALQANSVTVNTIAANAVTAVQIAANAVYANAIMANAVTAASIAANSITSVQIAANAVYAGALQANSVTVNTIAANAVTAVQIAANAVYANAIMTNAVTAAAIAANSITSVAIAANAVYAGALQANSVTVNTIAANAVTAVQIAANAVYANAIMANAITAAKISANSITSVQIAANAVYAGALQANSVTVNTIAANSITSVKIAANAIYAGAIMANAITTGAIAANAVTASQIDSRGLSIRDASGAVLFSAGTGVLSTAVKLDDGSGSSTTLSALFAAAGSASSPIQYIGSGATNPASGSANNVFKNTTNGNTYIWDTTIATPAWVIFVAKGTDGSAGSAGARGNYSIAATTTGSAWSDSIATAAITALDATGVKNRDQVTIYNSATKFSETRFWDGAAWTAISAYINGGLLVDGTISAQKLLVNSLSALSANIGVITTGKIAGDVVFSGNIYGANGTFSGSLTANAINAVDTVNIKNNAISGVVTATKLPTSAPVILAGPGARGILGQSTYNLYSIDMLTTGWTYIPNQTAITGILSLYTDVLDQFQGYDNYIGWLSDPQTIRYDPLRTELQYFRIRAAFGGSNQSGNPQTYWATVPGGAAGQAGQAFGANEITIIDQTFQSISTEVLDVGNVSGRGDPSIGNTPAYSYRRDKLIVAQTTLGSQAINTPGGPGWYRFVLDMIALPNPAANGKFNDPIIGLVDYSVPSQVWNYAITLVGRSGQTNPYAYPLMYHTIYSGSLTMLLNKK
jgi:hypothetical protein